MSNFITDLLSYSHLINDRKFEYLDLNNIIPDIKDKDIEIHCNDLPVIKGSKTMLIALFQNLIDNSIKYSSEKRKTVIHIKSYERENEWLFSITDNGIGIKEEDKENIFHMLYRANEVKGKYEGQQIYDVRNTAGKPARIILTASNDLIANGRDISYVDFRVCDKNGDRCYTATNDLMLDLQGPATLAGSGKISAVRGLTRVAIRSTGETGEITISASGENLKKGVITINAIKE